MRSLALVQSSLARRSCIHMLAKQASSEPYFGRFDMAGCSVEDFESGINGLQKVPEVFGGSGIRADLRESPYVSDVQERSAHLAEICAIESH